MNLFFDDLRRQQFRRYYQPTRILLGLIESGARAVNVITLCFSMTCSYKPPLVAIAVHRRSYSYELLSAAREFVLAVPGENLAQETLFCGVESGREVDKVRECGLQLVESKTVQVPGLESAIANLELLVRSRVETGDHRTVIGEVRRYAVSTENRERNLLSVGPKHDGYQVLAAKGIHRIGVVNSASASLT